jgi:CheY-like chemotaxis protein
MLRLVSSNNGEVFRHLGGAAFRRLDVDHRVGVDAASILALARELAPEVVLIDADLDGGTGFSVCRKIKDDPALAGVHVILLLSKVITRRELDGIELSRCDDVLALPISAEDFYHHIAQVAGLPFRRAPRISVELTTTLAGRVEQTRATVMNVSPTGLGVRLGRRLDPGQMLSARLRQGPDIVEVPGRIAWSCAAEHGEPGYIAGIELSSDVPIRTRLMLEQLALFEVVPSPDGQAGSVVVKIQGDLTEAVDLAPLVPRLASAREIVFDMAGVRYASSAGIKEWCALVGQLGGKSYAFRHCSLAFASQAAMVPAVLGAGRVLSLEAPYHCATCQRDELRLLETQALLQEDRDITPPVLRCVLCGGELEFDDVPNRYFAFLRGAGGSHDKGKGRGGGR